MPEEDEMTETSIWSTWTENTHHALLYISPPDRFLTHFRMDI